LKISQKINKQMVESLAIIRMIKHSYAKFNNPATAFFLPSFITKKGRK